MNTLKLIQFCTPIVSTTITTATVAITVRSTVVNKGGHLKSPLFKSISRYHHHHHIKMNSTLDQQQQRRHQKFSTSSTATTTTTTTSSSSSSPSIESIRKEFRSYTGGSFELTKDPKTGIALLCIKNIAKKNCFSGFMMAQFGDMLDQIEEWKDGKALVIYGERNFFSSGGDLDTVRQIANPDGGEKMIRLMQHNLERLQSLPLITVAYVEGMALGGGAEIMTACDYRLAKPDSSIGFVQIRVGITTVWGGGVRLVQLLGYGKALSLLATGRTIDGKEALRLGFVDHLIVDIPDLINLATVRANAIINKQHQSSPPSLVEGPTTINGNASSPMLTDHELHRLQVLQQSEDFLAEFLAHPRETMLIGKQVANEGRKLALNDALEQEKLHGLKVWGGVVHQKMLSNKVNHIKAGPVAGGMKRANRLDQINNNNSNY